MAAIGHRLLVAAFANQHREIFEVAHALGRARTTVRTHLRAVLEDVERLRQHSPELFAAPDGAVPVRRSVAVRE
jgi:hypothetical protein